MRRLLVPLLVAVALAGCGGDDEPAPAGGDGGALQVRGNGVDRAFIAAMVPHHEAGVAMARIALERAEGKVVRSLARDIAVTQRNEVRVLRARDRKLAAAGVGKGELGVAASAMGLDHDPDDLRRAEPFDRAFLEAMIPHHEGALVMAQAVLDRGEDALLRHLAEHLVDTQRHELAEMRDEAERVGAHVADGHDGHGG